jgi:hypothetical protein
MRWEQQLINLLFHHFEVDQVVLLVREMRGVVAHLLQLRRLHGPRDRLVPSQQRPFFTFSSKSTYPHGYPQAVS